MGLMSPSEEKIFVKIDEYTYIPEMLTAIPKDIQVARTLVESLARKIAPIPIHRLKIFLTRLSTSVPGRKAKQARYKFNQAAGKAANAKNMTLLLIATRKL